MAHAAGIIVLAHDLAATIDPERRGERGARDIDRGECPLVQQIAMERAAGISVMAHDLAAIIERVAQGGRGARNVERREAALVQQIAMERAAGICEIAHDLTASIDPAGIGERGARDINRRGSKREGRRCADQKSTERRHRASSGGRQTTSKECFLKSFCFHGCCFGCTYSFGKSCPAWQKKVWKTYPDVRSQTPSPRT